MVAENKEATDETPIPEPFVVQGNFFMWREWRIDPDPDSIPSGTTLGQYILDLNKLRQKENKKIKDPTEYKEVLDNQVFLRSAMAGSGFRWEGPVVEATCIHNEKAKKEGVEVTQGVEHEGAPHLKCTCGIHGYATLEDLLVNTFGGFTAGDVAGCIRGWGNISVHSFGSRTQFARPELLCVNPERFQSHPGVAQEYAEALRLRYDCEVLVQSISDFYIEWAEKLDECPYPYIRPPVQLSGMIIPSQEVNPEEIDWEKEGNNVQHRPASRTWHRDPRV